MSRAHAPLGAFPFGYPYAGGVEDVINIGLDPGARAGIELTVETAKELGAALNPCSGCVTREAV